MEEARALGDAAEAGLEAEAHDHLLRLGRRGAGAARLDRVGRGARRRAAAASGGLHQLRRQRPRLPRRGRLAHAGAVHQRRGARHRRSGDRSVTVWKRLQAQRLDESGHCRRRQEARNRARPAHRRAGLRLGLHGVPRSPGHRVARIWASAARTAAASTIPSTTTSTGTRISPTRDFVYGRALAQTAGTAVMRLADAELLPFDFDDFTDTDPRATSTRCRSWRATSATRSSSATGRSTKASSPPIDDPAAR